jgi:hypothetical protein
MGYNCLKTFMKIAGCIIYMFQVAPSRLLERFEKVAIVWTHVCRNMVPFWS